MYPPEAILYYITNKIYFHYLTQKESQNSSFVEIAVVNQRFNNKVENAR